LRRWLPATQVVAKPAEQTPLVAVTAVRLMHQAACRSSALHWCSATARPARHWWLTLVSPESLHGSTEVGHAINRALAAKDGPIVPFICRDGGVNAMIVDATACPSR